MKAWWRKFRTFAEAFYILGYTAGYMRAYGRRGTK